MCCGEVSIDSLSVTKATHVELHGCLTSRLRASLEVALALISRNLSIVSKVTKLEKMKLVRKGSARILDRMQEDYDRNYVHETHVCVSHDLQQGWFKKHARDVDVHHYTLIDERQANAF